MSKNDIYVVKELSFESIIKQLKKYNILDTFSSKEELNKWILDLSYLETKNILSLNIEPENIKFDSNLLIDKNLLNTSDYIKRVEALVSIENAEGWYHLFDRMLRLEFLNSEKFYQDIETLKRAKCAQIPLWIIGESTFINSPYNAEDFELLVTSKDISDKKLDYVVWDAIATVASNSESIKSEYHRQDLQTIVNYGSKALQMSNSYPEGSINNLAINKVSLEDRYHLENMDLLAQNHDIGNFLYAVMTNQKVIKQNNYRRIIQEMIDNKENKAYVFLVCYYAVGEKIAVDSQNVILHNYYSEIKKSYDILELIKKIDERINVIDVCFKETEIYEIEYNEPIKNDIGHKSKNLIKKVFRKN